MAENDKKILTTKFLSFKGLLEDIGNELSIDGDTVWKHVANITPNKTDIPHGFENKIKSKTFKKVPDFDIASLLETDPDFAAYYFSDDERYDEDEVDPHDIGLEIVVVDGELLDGYSRSASLLRQGIDVTNAYVAVPQLNEYDTLETDVKQTFDVNELKNLNSFNKRVAYCQNTLKRISSGSSRIVYLVGNDKVLKLAKNNKGLAQNEAEISNAHDYYAARLLAEISEYDRDDNQWLIMELARKLTPSEFQRITGFTFKEFSDAISNYYYSLTNYRNGFKRELPDGMMDKMWEDPFVSFVFDYLGTYGIPVGDLTKLNSWGIVKRDGEDTIVLIDYGLTDDVFNTHYNRFKKRRMFESEDDDQTLKTAVIRIDKAFGFMDRKFEVQAIPLHALSERLIYVKLNHGYRKSISPKNVTVLKTFDWDDTQNIKEFIRQQLEQNAY